MDDDLMSDTKSRREAEAVERLLKVTEAVRSEIREAAGSVDWDSLPAAIADRVLPRDARAVRPAPARRPFAGLAVFRMRPVLAGLAAGLVVGAAAMYFALRAPADRAGRGGAYFASSEFLDRAELEMARRNTLDYLEKSQYMLLDVFGSGEEGPVVSAALRSERTRGLLQKKKYLNGQLERFQMAKAKALCDQIEMLFRELAEISADASAAELDKIRQLVEERQLLLKINLVKKELQRGV